MPVDGAALVDLGDVVVGELDGELGLVHQHLDEALVLGARREDALHHQFLLEPLGPGHLGAEDLGHPAHGEPLQEEELAEDVRLEFRRRWGLCRGGHAGREDSPRGRGIQGSGRPRRGGTPPSRPRDRGCDKAPGGTDPRLARRRAPRRGASSCPGSGRWGSSTRGSPTTPRSPGRCSCGPTGSTPGGGRPGSSRSRRCSSGAGRPAWPWPARAPGRVGAAPAGGAPRRPGRSPSRPPRWRASPPAAPALLAAAALATAPFLALFARQAVPDAPLAALSTAGGLAFAVALLDDGAGPGWARAGWVLLGLATLAKGPLGFALPGGALLGLARRHRASGGGSRRLGFVERVGRVPVPVGPLAFLAIARPLVRWSWPPGPGATTRAGPSSSGSGSTTTCAGSARGSTSPRRAAARSRTWDGSRWGPSPGWPRSPAGSGRRSGPAVSQGRARAGLALLCATLGASPARCSWGSPPPATRTTCSRSCPRCSCSRPSSSTGSSTRGSGATPLAGAPRRAPRSRPPGGALARQPRLLTALFTYDPRRAWPEEALGAPGAVLGGARASLALARDRRRGAPALGPRRRGGAWSPRRVLSAAWISCVHWPALAVHWTQREVFAAWRAESAGAGRAARGLAHELAGRDLLRAEPGARGGGPGAHARGRGAPRAALGGHRGGAGPVARERGRARASGCGWRDRRPGAIDSWS